MPVLFITPSPYFTRAPIRLLAIMRHIKANSFCDIRTLVRKTGPLLHVHEGYAPHLNTANNLEIITQQVQFF